jgi:hypothetical protein
MEYLFGRTKFAAQSLIYLAKQQNKDSYFIFLQQEQK